jgi:hypothetical protein
MTAVPSRALGAIFLAVGLVFAALTYVVVRKIRRRRNQPLHECRPVVVIDRKLGIFGYRGGALVQLDRVRFAHKFQIGSSSLKLVALTPAAHRFSSTATRSTGVGNVDEVLTAAVQGAR